MNKYYVEIDPDKFEQTGEIEIIAPPKPWYEVYNNIFEVKKGSFDICRPDWLCNFICAVGGQRGKVAEFLIRRKDSQNKVLATNREIAAQTGVSLTTVNMLLQELDRAGCIKRRSGAVMMNPGVAHKGNRQREAYLMKLYDNFEKRANG